MNPPSFLKSIFNKALDNCAPDAVIRNNLQLPGNELFIKDHSFTIAGRPVFVLAVGKASLPMYGKLDEIIGPQLTKALIITPSDDAPEGSEDVEYITASHPYPNKKSLYAGEQAEAFMKGIRSDALLLTLISGGASSLMCRPKQGMSISDLTTLYKLLSNCGATVKEINTVRKQCSAIKGGQLLDQLKQHATIVNMAISDVPGDDISVIGSGPTVADDTNFEDARQVLHNYSLWDELPEAVEDYFRNKLSDGNSHLTQTPQDIPSHINHHSLILSSAGKLAENVSKLAKKEGIKTWIAAEAYTDDVAKVGADIAKKAVSYKQQEGSRKLKLFIFYGESTVKVTGGGKGGRNQELALRGGMEISGYEDICWLSAGTDGIDGPTDAAGAIVDSETIDQARSRDVDPHEYLRNNDSYHFHEIMNTHLKTGATGNNLMDLTLVLVE